MTNIPMYLRLRKCLSISLGITKNGVQYNYTGVTNGKSDAQQIFLEDVNIARFDRVLENEVRKFNPNVYSTLIDFELNKIRFPRL